MNQIIKEEPATLESVAVRLLKVVLSLGIHFVMLILVSMAIGWLVQVHLRFFDDHGLTLPAVTQSIIALSDFFVAYWYLVIILAMMFDTAVLLMIYFTAAQKRWLRVVYHTAWPVVTILVMTWIMLAMTMPMMKFTTVRSTL